MLDLLQVIVALGSFAWDAALRALASVGCEIPKPKPVFGHGKLARVGGFSLIGSYHPSQQNTFTGKLTEDAFDSVFARVRALLPPAE